MSKKFSNRIQAGQMLAQHLQAYSNLEDVLVLDLEDVGTLEVFLDEVVISSEVASWSFEVVLIPVLVLLLRCSFRILRVF